MKLSPLTIIICGLSLCMMFLSYGYFMHYSPNMAETKLNQDMQVKVQAEADKLPKAEKRKAQAIAMVQQAAGNWQKVVLEKTPPKGLPDGIDLSENAFQLTVDTPKFRNAIQRAVNNQMHNGGVKVLNGPAIPDPDPNAKASSLLASFYNYGPLKFPAVIFDLGTVTVQGTYKQIFDHVRAWSRMPHYLAVADGLRISGTSPQLTGTYQLTIVGFIRAKSIASAVSEGDAGANSSPFGGGMGGPPGGMGIPGGLGGPGRPPGVPGGK